MVVMCLEKVPRSLRGEITRWLVEVDRGVFVGRVSATVREMLWSRVIRRAGGGRCILAYSGKSEQGFFLVFHGYEDRWVRDFDGIALVTVRNAEANRKAMKLRR